MKVRIDDKLLPPKFRGKGYYITEDGKVYGVKGHRLKANDTCEYGLNPPKVLGRNLWWLVANTFVDNPNGYSKVVSDGKTTKWISDDDYYDLVEQYMEAELQRKPLNANQQAFIKNNISRMRKSDIARALGVSRMTVHRYALRMN